MKTKIEMMFSTNGKKRITIVAHSYGGVVMLYFLRNEVEQKWKHKYIKAFIPLGSPFGGATKIVGALVYGRLPFEIPFKDVRTFVSRQLRPAIRTFPSLYFLAPRHHVFRDNTLLQRGRRARYTSLDYNNIFNYRLGFSMYQATLDHNMHYHPGDPGVSTYCMFGTSIETPDRYRHRGNFDYIEDKDSHGDGTVDRKSLEVCAKWPSSRVAEVLRLPGVEHLSIVSNRRVLNAINRIVNP